MCGIVGYVGNRPCRDLLVAGLEKLEYRGYDSAGISLLEDGRIDSVRAVGNLANLREAAGIAPEGNGGVAVAAPPATIGLAHTRWATHGRVTEENAHPHGDCSDDVHIVLNGIVENHSELRAELTEQGHIFSSETDAEIVAHLIERNYEGDLTEAVRKSFNELRGHYAFAAMHAEQAETLVAARQECPLIVGIGEGETFLASAIPAFLAQTRRALAIENGEIVTVTPDGATLTDAEGTPIDRSPDEVTWDEDTAEKGGYETFMRKEIDEQPDAVAETIADRLPSTDRVDLSELDISPEFIASMRRIVIVACGTSLPRRARGPVRDRAVGAGAGRDGHRLRVPLPRSGGRGGRPRHRHHPVGRDRRHAGRDAPGSRARRDGAGAHEHHGQPGDARRRRRALHARRPRDRCCRHEDVHDPGRCDVPVGPLDRPAAGDDGGRPARRTDLRPQEPAAQDPGDARLGRGPSGGRRSRRARGPLLPLPRAATSAFRSASRARSR